MLCIVRALAQRVNSHNAASGPYVHVNNPSGSSLPVVCHCTLAVRYISAQCICHLLSREHEQVGGVESVFPNVGQEP